MHRETGRFFGIILSFFAMSAGTSAQVPVATPIPEDTVRVRTEEVHLTLYAEGPYAGLFPKLRAHDFTIYEDGVAQPVTSMRTVPARVMILMDTGVALTFAKTKQVTTLLAQIVVNNLPEGSYCSVAQYSEGVETIVQWTTERNRAVLDLEGLIKMGRRSLLGKALEEVTRNFVSSPIENRHLILVTDGLDGAKALDVDSTEYSALAAANITVHVLSYTALEQAAAKDAGRTVRLNLRRSKPRVPKEIFDDILRGLPIKVEMREFLRTMNEAQQIVVVDLDLERKKMLGRRREEWEKSEARLREVAAETGGTVSSPAVPTELFTDALDLARRIGSHYDVTYMSSRESSRPDNELVRTISVASRSDSLKLRARKTLRVRR